ncbi:cytoplasmic iron level regulating protein YaaA (DUF328/UPF0246 family) [Clostridium punense]|uniref:UPF0246 protein J2Z44_000320 n=1 Tax=Clostridium punense TaxID=1054297 RepID=A0ABS4K082_9CLOT|nr:peroxide stress protein YaaA [Clostridium punense]MBP2020536.1 cytoplasmic iron level regulating protein YaaA (DUF328/UPF0246 family) [Clostridium punense]
MITVISPAKTLDFESPRPNIQYTHPLFSKETNELGQVLKSLSSDDISKLMNISEALSKLNYDRFQVLNNDEERVKEAIFAFKGDVYKGLNIEEFSPEHISFAQENLRILSGLYGVLRPLDIIKEHRLEMGTKLKFNSLNNLYDYWEDKLSLHIEELVLQSTGDKVLINLASDEYSKALKLKKLSKKIRVINVIFKENKNNEYKIIGLYAKKARGLMTSYIMRNEICEANKIKTFSTEGYKFSQTMSDENNIVFIR